MGSIRDEFPYNCLTSLSPQPNPERSLLKIHKLGVLNIIRNIVRLLFTCWQSILRAVLVGTPRGQNLGWTR